MKAHRVRPPRTALVDAGYMDRPEVALQHGQVPPSDRGEVADRVVWQALRYGAHSEQVLIRPGARVVTPAVDVRTVAQPNQTATAHKGPQIVGGQSDLREILTSGHAAATGQDNQE